MKIENDLKLVEKILGDFKAIIGNDFNAYRNHVYRVINLCYTIAEFDLIEKEKIQIAACFHDLGIWTEGSLDYLGPSELAAARYLEEKGKSEWIAEISEMIVMHHRIRSCVDSEYKLVDIFRRADIADFTLGIFSVGVCKDKFKQVRSEFPNSGFHKRLLELGVSWLFRNPLNPLPMFRF